MIRGLSRLSRLLILLLIVLMPSLTQPIWATDASFSILLAPRAAQDSVVQRAVLELSGQLQQAGIHLQIESLEIGRIRAHPVVRLGLTRDGWLRIILDQPDLVLPSPLLEKSAEIHLPLDDETLPNQLAALAFYAIGNCESAQAYLEISAGLEFYSANCALLRGDFQAAAEDYEKASAGIDRFAAVNNRVWVMIQQGERTKAIDTFNLLLPSLRLHEETVFYAQRSQFHALIFDYTNALADIDRAIEIKPSSAALYTVRGQIYLLTYEWDSAMESLNLALSLDADFAPARFYRGLLFYTLNQREAALDDFQRYLDLEPDGAFAASSHQSIESIQAELSALTGN